MNTFNPLRVISGLTVFFLFLCNIPALAENGVSLENEKDAILKPMEPYGGFMRKLESGKRIWTEHHPESYRWPINREHVFGFIPEALKGKGYILSPMEYSEAYVEKEGYVYVITPTPVAENVSARRFSKSVAAQDSGPANMRVAPYYTSILSMGFERMYEIPEFNISETMEEKVAVYRKYAEKGETIRYGNPGWGVTIAGLPEGFESSETEEIKKVELVKTPPEILLNPGEEYALASRTYQGLPGIEATPEGRLWAAWVTCNCGVFSEGPRNYSVLVTSEDGGETWSDPPVLAIKHPVWPIASIDAVPWIDPSGRLWIFWTQYDVPMDRHDSWGIVTENPQSSNPSWSEPMPIGRGTLLNKPTVLSTGEWLFPSSPRGTPVDIYVSKDKGETISHLAAAAVPMASWNEHMIVEMQDESLWMLVRTFGARSGISQTFSHDRGKTWTTGERYWESTSSRFHIRRLNSGRILLITHPKGAESRIDMTAYLSEDEGKTWPYELLLYKGGCSAPDAIETEDGLIYAVYDAGRMGRLGNNWVGQMGIVMSVFTEEDIMAGKFVGENSKTGVLISGRDLIK